MKTDCPPTSRFPVPAGLCWLLALLPGALPAAAQLPASPAAPGETWPLPAAPPAGEEMPELLLALAGAAGAGPTSAVATSGRTTYVLDYEHSQLVVFVVGAGGRLVPQGWVATGAGPYSLAVRGGTAYVVSEGSDVLQLFDVRDPAHLVLLPEPLPLLMAAPLPCPTR